MVDTSLFNIFSYDNNVNCLKPVLCHRNVYMHDLININLYFEVSF